MSNYIETISFNKYKRLANIDINLNQEINIIAGTNGTCKSSILHIISNSYQALRKQADKYMLKDSDNDSVAILDSILISVNPKIETLNRGSKAHNDPAPNITPYYTVKFCENKVTQFRKHDSTLDQRFRVIPYYKKGTSESLPKAMIAYLGIKRLMPIGEIGDNDILKFAKKNLPINYREEVASAYSKFTGRTITDFHSQEMGGIKKNFDFRSDDDGFDSNTISAGEDNLLILITTLICLKYFRQSLKEEFKELPAILLIDEFDATLHPEFQLKLFDLMKKYSIQFKIQIIFTTHSLTLLEHAISKKANVIYLIDDIHKITSKESVDIFDIQKYLKNQSYSNLYTDRKIPLFTEDAETRILLDTILDKISTDNPKFNIPFSYFHYLNENFGSEILTNIFVKDKVVRNSIRSICIVDGDKHTNLTGNYIALPGNNKNISPEQIAFNQALELLNDESAEADVFWDTVDRAYGITRLNFKTNIAENITEEKINEVSITTGKKKREIRKDLFNKDLDLYKNVFKFWVSTPSSADQIAEFLKNLECAFRSTCNFNNISSNVWPTNTD